MAYPSKSNDSDCEVEGWQNQTWCSLISPCIFGLACTEAIVRLMHNGFPRSSDDHPSVIKGSVPADADSYARAMDMVIGETTLLAFFLQDNLSGAAAKNVGGE